MDRSGFVASGVQRTGRFLTTTGVIALLFVLHQLWGTDARAAWEQRALRTALEQGDRSDAAGAAPGTKSPGVGAVLPPTGPDPTARRLDGHRMPAGTPVARLRADAIGLDAIVVEGADRESLQKGPGHVAATAALGGPGNAVVSGHRTTWGSPFSHLDRLRAGDRLVLTVRGQENNYQVTGRRVTTPDEPSVLAGAAGSRITLVTCHPRYSAARRFVVTADAVTASPVLAGPAAGDSQSPAGTVAPREFLVTDERPHPVDVAVPLGVALLTWWLGGLPWRSRAHRPAPARRRVVARCLAGMTALAPLAVAFDRLADLVPSGW